APEPGQKSPWPQTWTQSEPPRGSGWVRSLLRAYGVPTRHRVVVLTVSKIVIAAESGPLCLRRCCRSRGCHCVRRRSRFGRSSREGRSEGFRLLCPVSPNQGRRSSASERVGGILADEQ